MRLKYDLDDAMIRRTNKAIEGAGDTHTPPGGWLHWLADRMEAERARHPTLA